MKHWQSAWKIMLRRHGHELFLAAALTLIGVGALIYSFYGVR